MTRPMARALGSWATIVAIVGMAVGTVHLIGTDTTTFLAFSDTFEAAGGSEAAAIGVDLLLRLHAATLTSWITSFWFMTPFLVAAAMVAEGKHPTWLIAVAGVSAACQVVSLVLFFQAARHTTVSESGVFRIGATLLIALVGILAWELRRSAEIGKSAHAVDAGT